MAAAAHGAAQGRLHEVGLNLSTVDGVLQLNGAPLRVTATSPKLISVFDAIMAVNKCTAGAASCAWALLVSKQPEVCPYMRAGIKLRLCPELYLWSCGLPYR
jgi:hypothetical protein